MSLTPMQRAPLSADGPKVIIVITGSREATKPEQRRKIGHCLEPYSTKWRPHEIVMFEGEAVGADRWARECGERFGWRVEKRPADWALGKKAGPLRNREMIRDAVGVARLHQAALIVLAFPVHGAQNRGTRDLVAVAWQHEIKTFITWL